MSAALSSRPLGGRGGALFKRASTPTTATTTLSLSPRTATVAVSASASADSPSFSSSSVSATRVLANGTTMQALWLDRSALAYDILIGQNFVVHRPRRGGPGLVPSPRAPAFARTRSGAAESGAAEKHQRSLDSPSRFRPRSGPPAHRGGSAAAARFLLLSSGDAECGAAAAAAAAFFDVTDYSVAESSPSTALAAARSSSPPRVFFLGTSGGLAAPGGGAFRSNSSPPPPPPPSSGNPRRTRRLAWTCNLCGGRKVSPVNPLAWEKGSVFIRCTGCDVVHKVKDNLKIFHELAGQVYPIGNGGALPPEAAAAAEAALRKWNQGN